MVTDHSSLAVFSPFYDALINSRCCDVARTPIFAIVWLLPLTWSSLAPNHDERCLRNLWDPIFTKPQILPDAIHTTQLRELLRSNVLPPAHLDATLRDVIHKAPVVLERYDAEIETLQNMLSGLVAERSSLAAHFEACRSVFPPIRRLPVELLAEVFEMCSPFNDQSSLSRDQYSSLPDPNTPGQELDRLAQCHLLVLSQVSSLWHNVALDIPKLWSTISLDTSLWTASCPCLSLLGASLKRSGKHPVKIRVDASTGHLNAHPALELLSQHARRWQEVHFWVGPDFTQYLSNAKGNLPLLKTLHLGTDWKGVDIFEIAPALRKVSFCGSTENIAKLPWPQIREFTYVGHRAFDPAPALSLTSHSELGPNSYLMSIFRIHPPTYTGPRFHPTSKS
ncbi:hypothetical protein B0H13DRAFT_129401 [Mycena leptocephala]|nr:hypothetical protein B0H13DRAFT_129401 [Mycena leptocephala]